MKLFIASNYEYDYGFILEINIDCGANIGLVSVFFKNKFPDSHILAIEPEVSNFEILKKNV